MKGKLFFENYCNHTHLRMWCCEILGKQYHICEALHFNFIPRVKDSFAVIPCDGSCSNVVDVPRKVVKRALRFLER